MRRILSIVAGLFLLISLSLLSGCGGGGSGGGSGSSPPPYDGIGGGAKSYGTLTFSGTGSTSTGTTFNALSLRGGSYWYSIDVSTSLTYPHIVVTVVRDMNGAVSVVEVRKMISEAKWESWLLMTVPAAQVAVTATDVTFTNLVLPGDGGTTTTSLTVNGTLKF